MTKGSDLGSDIDFIKEFEELRLKQKILIESLNKQKKSKEAHLVTEMNSKLDFLVKLFKDSEGTEEFNEEEFLEKKFSELTIRLQDVERVMKDMDEKMGKLESKVTILSEMPKEEPKPELDETSAKAVPLPGEAEFIPPKPEEKLLEEPPAPEPLSTPPEPKAPEPPAAKPPEPSPPKPPVPEEPILDKATMTQDLPKDQNAPPDHSVPPKKADDLAPPPGFVVDESKVEKLAQESDDEKKGKGWFNKKK